MKMIKIKTEHGDFEITSTEVFCTLAEMDSGVAIRSVDFLITEVNDLMNGLRDLKREWRNEYE